MPIIDHRRSGLRALAALGLVLAAGTAAKAQPYDHLKCFKVRDEATFSSAVVDLDALAASFGLQSCEIKGRAKKICVPADAGVTSIQGGSVSGLEGEDLLYARLCYKMRCPAQALGDEVVSDPFGTRTVGGFKAVELCAPAVLGGATTTTTSTTTTTLPPDLDDDFGGSALDAAWSVLHPSRVTLQVGGGFLSLVPTVTGQPGIWFESGEGPLVYKEVTGDFDVSTTITTRDPAMHANPPPPQYRLAGILARDPASSPASSNAVHVALGAGATGQGTCYEYKSTDDSVSTWVATPTASPSGQLRLVRSGTNFEMFHRATAMDAWNSIYSVNRPDLPATLQVGPMVYSVESPASIEALFDDIDFQ